MSQLGMGVMIRMLGGNAETVDAYHKAMGKSVASVALDDDRLKISFDDGSSLSIYDDGQSCCEHRYITCDDDLSSYTGDKLASIELREAENAPDEYGEHEQQFVDVRLEIREGRVLYNAMECDRGHWTTFATNCALSVDYFWQRYEQ